MRNLEVWYARLDEDAIREQLRNAGQKQLAEKAEKGAAKARAKDSLRALGKLTERVDGELRIVSRPPLVVPIEELLPDGRRRSTSKPCSRESSRATRRR